MVAFDVEKIQGRRSRHKHTKAPKGINTGIPALGQKPKHMVPW